MKTSMKQLKAWAHGHPITAVIFSMLTAFLATSARLRPDWLVGCLLAFALLLLALVLTMRRTLPVLLVLAMAVAPLEARADQDDGGQGGGCPGAAIAGVVCLVVGGVAIYMLASFCAKTFPKPPPPKPPVTNSIPTNVTFTASASAVGSGSAATDGASFGITEMGSCPAVCLAGEGGSGDSVKTTYAITLHVERGTEPGEAFLRPVALDAYTGQAASLDWQGYVTNAAAYGLSVTGRAGDHSYSHNGQPCQADQSPFLWDAQRGLIKYGTGSQTYYTVVVERSEDLRHWTPALKTEVEVGRTIQLVDTSDRQQQRFYRYYGFLSD